MALQGSLDTSAIVRLLTNDIPLKRDKIAHIIESSNLPVAVADIAIAETVFVLGREYGFNRPAIAASLRAFMLHPKINCNRIMIDRALELFVGHSALSFEDCCLAVYAELNDAVPLYTFDKKLAAQTAHAQLV